MNSTVWNVSRPVFLMRSQKIVHIGYFGPRIVVVDRIIAVNSHDEFGVIFCLHPVACLSWPQKAQAYYDQVSVVLCPFGFPTASIFMNIFCVHTWKVIFTFLRFEFRLSFLQTNRLTAVSNLFSAWSCESITFAYLYIMERNVTKSFIRTFCHQKKVDNVQKIHQPKF